MRNRLRYEGHVRTSEEIEELRRICYEEANQVRSLQVEDLSLRQERDPNTVSRPLKHIHQELQDQVSSWAEAKEFHDLDTASSSGVSHVPSQPVIVPSSRETHGRDSGLPTTTQDTTGNSGNVFVNPAAQEGYSLAIFNNSRNQASLCCGMERAAKFLKSYSRLPTRIWYIRSCWWNLFSRWCD